MIWVLVYIVSAAFLYNFAYRFIRRIDKKERQKLNKWEYQTLGEVRNLLNEIYKDMPDNITLGVLESYIEDKKKEIAKK